MDYSIGIGSAVHHCVTAMVAHGSICGTGLVVGCGPGDEADHLGRITGARIIGVDVATSFIRPKFAKLMRADATSLPFSDTAFDFAYSYHALEHISNPVRALHEVWRTLKPGAMFYVGVPNRTRLIGYLGSASATVSDKIRWNIADYRARLAGRFRNELGAHAGFSATELLQLLRDAHFADVTLLTHDYFASKYHGPLGLLMRRPTLLPFLAGGQYALCFRP